MLRTVDVIIPTIGRESLRRTVESANRQTVHSNVFVVNDGQNMTESIRNSLGGLDYTLLSTGGAKGGAVARNVGFEAGSSPYVAFLDDDDWWDPHYLESRLQVSAEREDCSLVIGAFLHELEDSSVAVPTVSPPVDAPRNIIDYMVYRDRLKFGRNAVQSSSLLFKRASLPERPWDELLKKHQDWDLVARLVSVPGIVIGWDPRPLAHVAKDSPGSVSKVSAWQASLDWWRHIGAGLSRRASADFLSVHVLRAALRARSGRGVRLAVSSMRSVPHLSALILGLSGVLR